MTTEAQPIVTLADAIADVRIGLHHANGGLCIVSARSLGMVVDAAELFGSANVVTESPPCVGHAKPMQEKAHG